MAALRGVGCRTAVILREASACADAFFSYDEKNAEKAKLLNFNGFLTVWFGRIRQNTAKTDINVFSINLEQ